jgi:hypothetical protein
MPYLGCTKCHHEWESDETSSQCDWCGAPGYILEEETPLEQLIATFPSPAPEKEKEGKELKSISNSSAPLGSLSPIPQSRRYFKGFITNLKKGQ